MQQIKHKKNTISDCIAIKKKNNSDSATELQEMKIIGKEILSLEEEKATVESKFKDLMMTLPNMVDKSVPIGNNETDNLVIKQKEINKNLRFRPRDHVDISTKLGLIDLERAAKISGA